MACDNRGLVPTHKVGCGCGGALPSTHRLRDQALSHLPAAPPRHEVHTATREHTESLVLTEASTAVTSAHSPTAELAGGPPSHRGWQTGRSSWTSAGRNHLCSHALLPLFPEVRAGVGLGRRPLPSCLIPEKPPSLLVLHTFNAVSLQIRVPCAGAL